MGISIIIAHDRHEIMDKEYFVEKLKEKWPAVKVHFVSDSSEHSLLQFRTPDDFRILGDFTGTGVSYKSDNSSNDAQFAIWYRSVAPSEWQLRIYDSALTFDVMFLTNDSTEEQLIAGFKVPFDVSKHQ